MKPELRDKAIILFDGECNLCNASVIFVVKRDKKEHFHYSHLQSEAGQAIRREHDIPDSVDSILLYENGKVHTRSSAALHIAQKLSGGWPFLYVFMIIPRPIRDWIYNIVARNRYRWFGKQEQCMVPTAGVKARFI